MSGRWWSTPGRPIWLYLILTSLVAIVVVTLIGPLWFVWDSLGRSIAATATLAGAHFVAKSFLERNDPPDD